MSIQFVTCIKCNTVVDANDCMVKPTDNTIEFEYTCKKCYNTPTNLGDVEKAFDRLIGYDKESRGVHSYDTGYVNGKIRSLEDVINDIDIVKQALSQRVITADEIVKELNEYTDLISNYTGLIGWVWDDNKTGFGFVLIDNNTPNMEMHLSSIKIDKESGRLGINFSLPPKIISNITTFFTQQKEAQDE